MSIFGFAWYYVIVFLIVLTVLVFVHEWGHYWVARRSGVRVEVFSIGFGPEIFGWTDSADTRWKVCAVPLGGYVKMFGEADLGWEEEEEATPLTDAERSVSFHHKRLWQRAAIVAAGPIANFLFAMVVISVLAMAVGMPRPLAAVGEVLEGSAAAEAGLTEGDRITAINGEAVKWFNDLRERVSANPGVTLDFTVVRDGREMALAITPKPVDSPVEGRIGQLGVKFLPTAVAYERLGPASAVSTGVTYTFGVTARIFSSIGEIFTGERSSRDLSGPLGIARISGEIAQGGTIDLIMFMAMLSINLGLINLFPIPVLDGGRLVYYAAEALRGRPLGPKAEEYGLRFGLILVLLLFVFVTWNDILNLL